MSHSAAARRAVPGVLLALVVLSFLPARYSAWIGWFGELSLVVLTPVSHPMSMVSRWLAPATRGPAPPEEVARLEAEVEHWRSLFRREQRESEDLRRQIRELNLGLTLVPDAGVQQLIAPVVGDTADLSSGVVRIRAGSRQGVVENTVVAVGGMHLFGRVERVFRDTCEARPITDENAGAIHTVIIAGDEEDAPRLLCRLEPQEDGTLRGPVEYERAPESATPVSAERGQTVYLDDDTWPKSSRMLIVGHVRSVTKDPDFAQRQIVVVAPEMNLSRVSEVVLRLLAEEAP
jgi:cell shape-determining protein MreC